MAVNQDALTRREAKSTEGPVFRLIYRSRSRIPYAKMDGELAEIFRGARANNGAAGITGALLYYDDWFAQTLEGPEAAVRDLFARIKRDDRHDSVELQQEGVVGDRVFSRWAMARVAEHGDPDIFLVAGPAGLVESSSRKTTSDQERILAAMRDATRGYGLGS
jgi:hypothetical protein